MSEYQYYAWQAIDRPLTHEERVAVNKLSSHITVTSNGAWVDYSYGDFKHDPRQVLLRYFDAFIYLANWGSKRLVFRFPKHLLNPRPIQPYIVERYITLETFDQYHVLTLDLQEEEPEDVWIEGDAWLPALAPLRADILRGDYRVLYIAWLRAVELSTPDEIAEDEPEPPVPPGLRQLNAALASWVDLLHVDEHLLAAAAEASEDLRPDAEVDFSGAISRLPRAEADDFLLRLLQDEPNLALALRRHLQDPIKLPAPKPASARRTVEELLAAQAVRTEVERQRQAEAARIRHQQEMADLARREAEVWREVERLIEKATGPAYDEGVQLLVKLRQLAEYQDTLPAFQQRMDTLAGRYLRRTALQARFRKHGLL
jgi:hypothetical protein